MDFAACEEDSHLRSRYTLVILTEEKRDLGAKS